MRATSFREVRALLERAGDEPALAGPWSYTEVLQHCAQSIECSMRGYPKLRSGLFRATVGRIAKSKFLKQGYMSHDLGAPVPGAESLDAALPVTAARERLLSAISTFEAFEQELSEHLAYGPCTKAEYERLHSMHVANHLEQSTATRR